MSGTLTLVARQARQSALAVGAAAVFTTWLLATPAAAARGPDRIADVAEMVIDAVVNISTSQTVDSKAGPAPQLPPGSPFEEFFEEFFKNRRGQQGEQPNRERSPRRV